MLKSHKQVALFQNSEKICWNLSKYPEKLYKLYNKECWISK